LVPKQGSVENQQLSGVAKDYEGVPQVAPFQQLADENEIQRSNASKRKDAGGGLSFGHSAEALIPCDESFWRGVSSAYEEGKRPEEIHALHPEWKLSAIYAAIAVYLARREADAE
jgi:hypothetical protein